MIDFYALPSDFPNCDACAHLRDPYQRVACVEKALADDIKYHRFIPYIQLHEFEALIFADPSKRKQSA